VHTLEEVITEPEVRVKKPRILGLDVARGLAVLGIFLNHYGGIGSVTSTSGWYKQVVKFTDGRILPVFVLLSGAGFTFLMRRSTRPIREIAGRAAFLLIVGLLFQSTMAIGVILQYYAFYFLVALLFQRLASKWLLWSAAIVAITGALTTMFLNEHLPQSLKYSVPNGNPWGSLRILAHPWTLFTDLAFGGQYPLFPVFSLFLTGMWLARQDLTNIKFRKRLGAIGVAMLVVGTGIGWSTSSHRPAEYSAENLQQQLKDLMDKGMTREEAAAELGLAGGGPQGQTPPQGDQPEGDQPPGAKPAGGQPQGDGQTTPTQSDQQGQPQGSQPTQSDQQGQQPPEGQQPPADGSQPPQSEPTSGDEQGEQPPQDAQPVGDAPAYQGAGPGDGTGQTPDGQTPPPPGDGPPGDFNPFADKDWSGWNLLDESGHSNMPTWIFAVTGLALALVSGCLALADRFRKVMLPLAHAGQLALTLYLGHIMLLRWPLKKWPNGHDGQTAVLLVFAGFAVCVGLSTLWRRKFPQGPLELVMRAAGNAASGRPIVPRSDQAVGSGV
jgi:uncharacterized membrane protein YeiB